MAQPSTWIFASPTSSSGLEYGTLPGGESHRSGALFFSNGTYQNDVDCRWGYLTAQARWRANHGTARPEVNFGLGSYVRRTASAFVERDSVGTVVYEATGESRESTFGINLGTGVYFGRGPFHPGVDARVHWALSANQFWYTLGLKADWH